MQLREKRDTSHISMKTVQSKYINIFRITHNRYTSIAILHVFSYRLASKSLIVIKIWALLPSVWIMFTEDNSAERNSIVSHYYKEFMKLLTKNLKENDRDMQMSILTSKCPWKLVACWQQGRASLWPIGSSFICLFSKQQFLKRRKRLFHASPRYKCIPPCLSTIHLRYKSYCIINNPRIPGCTIKTLSHLGIPPAH